MAMTSENSGPVIARVSIAVYAVAVFFVALRFFTRGWLVKKLGLDDFFIGLALLFGAGETATLLFSVKYGRGRHSDEIEQENLNKMNMYKYLNMLLYYVANWTVKMSVLALYHRICSLQKGLPYFLRGTVIWMMAVAITAFTLSFFLVEAFSCMPLSGMFDSTIPKKCIAWVPFYNSQAAINVFIDVVLLLFPLPLLRILKIDKKQRYALILIFSIGLFPLIATTIRFYQITIAVGTEDATRPYGDRSWKWRWFPVWSQIEVDVGIVAASLPSLSPLLKQIWSGWTHDQSILPSEIPTLIETSFTNRRGEVQGLQKLPSTISTLPNKSVSTLGDPDNSDRLTFFDDSRNSEEGEVDFGAFPNPYSATQIGVARTVNARLSRATFVDMPASPRRNAFPGHSMPETTG